MKIVVKGYSFVRALNSLCSDKQVANLSIKGNKLYIQVFEPIIVDESIAVDQVLEVDSNREISVKFNKSYNLIEDTDDVLLTFYEKELHLSTPSVTTLFTADFKNRMEIAKSGTAEVYSNIDVTFLQTIARCTTSISNITKMLKLSEPAVLIKDGNAYVSVGEFVYKTKSEFPDCIIPISVVKALNSVFAKDRIKRVNLEIEREHGRFCVIRDTGNDRVIAFTLMIDRGNFSSTIESILKGLDKINSLSFDVVSNKIKLMSQVYKNIEVAVLLSNSIGITITEGVSKRIYFGNLYPSNKENTVNWKTSLVMLQSVSNIFGSNQVEVLKGGRYLCLRDNNQTILTTGVV